MVRVRDQPAAKRKETHSDHEVRGTATPASVLEVVEPKPSASRTGPPVLEARGVSKRFGCRDALCGVNLFVEPGQLHGLLGPNGAGKTTLMRVLLGLVRRDAGTVDLFGRRFERASGRVPDGVAGLVETPAFYPYLSGAANLTLLTRLDNNTHPSNREASISRALEQTGLGEHAGVALSAYSAGMRQRLGLASALVRAPRLLFLDEPTSALDPAGARDVRALARELAAEGTAVVLSSHDMAEVEELCSTLTIIDRGRVVFAGSVDALRARAHGDLYALRTSDDRAAVAVTAAPSAESAGVVVSAGRGVIVTPSPDGGLDLAADLGALDAYVIALGRAGIAVRLLERRARSLESLFLELTNQDR